MPLYTIQCRKCEYETDEIILMAEATAFLKSLDTMKCPRCGKKGFDQDWGKAPLMIIKDSKVEHNRTMAKRFKKRNAKLEAMPKQNQEKMKKFMYKYNVRRTP